MGAETFLSAIEGCACAFKGGGGNFGAFMEWNEALAVIGGTGNDWVVPYTDTFCKGCVWDCKTGRGRRDGWSVSWYRICRTLGYTWQIPIAQNLTVFRDIYLQCHNLIDAAYETTLSAIVLLFLQMIIQISIDWRPLGIPDSFVRKKFMQIFIRGKFKTMSMGSRGISEQVTSECCCGLFGGPLKIIISIVLVPIVLARNFARH